MHHTVTLLERRTPAPDLQRRYAELNRELFDDKLPEIPIYWDALTSVGGKVQFKIRRVAQHPTMTRLYGKYHGAEMVPDSLFMVVTNLYQREAANLDGLLVHEMIHVWFAAVDPQFDEQHGPRFMAKLRELQAKVDFPIPLKDNVASLDLAAHVTPKPVTIVWATRMPDTPVFQFLPDSYRKDPVLQDRVHAVVDQQVSSGYLKDAAIYTMQSPAWMKVRAAAVIPRQFRAGAYVRQVHLSKYMSAVQEVDAATPVWTSTAVPTP